MRPNSCAFLGVLLLLSAPGCGGGTDETSDPNTDSSGGSDSGGSGSGGSGSGGSGSGGAGTGGALGGVDCSGVFAAPAPIFRGIADRISSPSLSDDELVLFYVEGSDPEQFWQATRLTRDGLFGESTPRAELDALCNVTDMRGVELSGDGLRAYVSCYTDLTTSVPLQVVERATRASAFGAPRVVGSFPASVALSPNELVAYGAPYGVPPTIEAHRSSVEESFVNGVAPGLEAIALFAPEISPDGLTLAGGLDYSLQFSSRTTLDAAFTAPVVAPFLLPEFVSSGAPVLSGDCRTIYFIGVANDLGVLYRSER